MRPATPADLPDIHRLTQEAARWMVERGIEQWRPDDLLARRVDETFAEGVTLVVCAAGAVVGSVSVLWEDRLGWGDEGDDGRAGYVNLLVGRGYGRRLLDAAESVMRAQGRALSRLDCVVSSAKLRSFYERAGYTFVRETDFGGRCDIPRCGLYEKDLRAGPAPTA
jgi:predicted N-acetyltransferase YhbS